MKKFTAIGLLAGVLLFLGASCSFTTASIDAITMTDQVDETTQQAVNPKTDFPPNVGTIYASVSVKNAPAETVVKGEWFYNDQLLGDKDVTVDGTRSIGFRLSEGTFEPGTYKFRASIGDSDKAKETTFTVTNTDTSGDTSTDTNTDNTQIDTAPAE